MNVLFRPFLYLRHLSLDLCRFLLPIFNRMLIRTIFALLLTLFFADFINAQDYREQMTSSEQAIYDLREGTAIVRLYMNNPKSKRLEELIKRKDLSDKERSRLQKQLDDHLRERKNYAINTIKAFDEYYDFAKVLFMPDYLTTALNQGKISEIFYNDKAEIDPFIKLETENYFIIGRGNRDEDFIVLDAQGRPLPNEFPARVNLSIIDGIGLLFERRLPKTLKKLNDRHYRYFDEVYERYNPNARNRRKR